MVHCAVLIGMTRAVEIAGMIILAALCGFLLFLATACTPAIPAPVYTPATTVFTRHLNPVEQTAIDGSPQVSLPYRAMLTAAAQRWWGLNAPIPLMAGQIHQESGWQPDIVSPAGAKGLAQFMDGTANDYPDSTGRVDPMSPEWAFDAQSRYMVNLYKSVHYSKDCDRYGAALQAYNSGLGWGNKRQARAANPDDFWGSVRTINPGITASNQREAEDYAPRIVYQRQPLYKAWGVLICPV